MRFGPPAAPADVLDNLRTYLAEQLKAQGGATRAVDPGDRIPFHWPPDLISTRWHVSSDQWQHFGNLDLDGQIFEITHVAVEPDNHILRIADFGLEARGLTAPQARHKLDTALEPLLRRQSTIARTLGHEGRFTGDIVSLPPHLLIRLLFCPDRDVAIEASHSIEAQASTGSFTPALITILKDRTHALRRSAQWCVLDMFEDLPSFCPDAASQQDAVNAMRDLLMDAEDDYCRTIYKAGVVLGGHVCTDASIEAVLAALNSKSRIGRRSAIHACFHVVEWRPERAEEVLAALDHVAHHDPEPILRTYAAEMTRDIQTGNEDHISEPAFND